jgi:hypothetical protein
MHDHRTVEKLKADRQNCLRHLRRDGTFIGCTSFLVVLLHFVFRADLLRSALIVTIFSLSVLPWGVAYVILGWHIRRMDSRISNWARTLRTVQ